MLHLANAERLRKLTVQLLSEHVQVPKPLEVEDVPARLDDDEVQQVFRKHVPGVEAFVFRGKRGVYVLPFMASAYREGLRAFQGTPVHVHLLGLMRMIVHHGFEGGEDAAGYLREVAEAFMDCQAVQARSIERVGLRLRGTAPDFKGLVTRLVGEYKTLAIKMLAADRLAQGLAKDYDAVPTHYENRLTADLGSRLGLDLDAVRLAALDGHAAKRFPCLTGEDADAAVERCRELFDLEALLQAFVAEVNSFSFQSAAGSLAVLFLQWVSENLADKHAVLDELTCSQTQIDVALALCVLEVVFLGAPSAADGELYRGRPIGEVFAWPVVSSECHEDVGLSIFGEVSELCMMSNQREHHVRPMLEVFTGRAASFDSLCDFLEETSEALFLLGEALGPSTTTLSNEAELLNGVVPVFSLRRSSRGFGINGHSLSRRASPRSLLCA